MSFLLKNQYAHVVMYFLSPKLSYAWNAKEGSKRCNVVRQAHKRALETDHESEQRREADRAQKAHRQALESREEYNQ